MAKTFKKSEKATDDLGTLVQRAEAGDEKAMTRLRSLYEPDAWQRVYESIGDLAKTAETSLIRAAAGENLVIREAIHCRMQSMRSELSDSSPPSLLETLLIERIVACWLHLNYAEVLYAQNMQHLDYRQAAFHLKRMESAQRRYLQAIKGLAQVRRLLGPAVQVNVANQQVNIAG